MLKIKNYVENKRRNECLGTYGTKNRQDNDK